ncbi:uncharacterized protein LOC133515618 [Cydia pomonella]|uniref:uncharacterized protein LOC133515618 n=1 Tax=Cydia pomonella TaxID=82600 RepID=UPI002ADD3980|nr:uncharacterized protein LOC133515618 [Cydia pomonella]
MEPFTCRRCNYCNEDVPANRLLAHSNTKKHQILCGQEKDSEYSVYVVNSAFKCRIITYRINGTAKILDPRIYLLKIKQKFEDVLKTELQIHKHIKVNVSLHCTYVKTDSDGGVMRDLKSFNTKNASLHDGALDFPEYFDNTVLSISKKSEDFQERDSGWALEKIEYFNININKYKPLKASSYIPLPREIQGKRACVNVKNSDHACFFWAIVSALYPKDKNSDRTSSYPHYSNVLKLNRIKCPVTFLDIKRFEKLNKLSVNVYGIEDNNNNNNNEGSNMKKKNKDLTISPLRVSKVYGTMEKHVNLLYYEKGNVSHYCWIKNLSRLVHSQISKHKNKLWLCEGCLQHFYNNEKLKLHLAIGCGNKLIQLPEGEEKIVKFKNTSHKMKVPFVIYADFESILMPIEGERGQKSAFTYNTHKHVACSFAYYIHCEYDSKLSQFRLHRGEDCVNKFIESIFQDAERIGKTLNTIIPPSSSSSTSLDDLNDRCHICEKLIENGESYVIDHCHLTGIIRGKVHNSCNLNYKVPTFIPVIFHNLSGYDSHLFIKELAKSEGEIRCIPHNKEKYISFYKNLPAENITLKFIDSYKFMASSLDALVKNLSREQFKILPNYLPSSSSSSSSQDYNNSIDSEVFMKLLTRKGVYPYEYVDGWSKLEETSLPSQNDFYNQLTNSNVSDKDYQHAQVVWKTFNIKTLGEYCDLYLQTDVLLLAEVFENFREICMNTYKLDPCQYVTAPGLSWDAMLKYTGIELELFTDYEMIQFIKMGIRGGISQVSKRYAKANNCFMKEYDEERDSSFIVYLDVNNLYGEAMSRSLPIRNFKWLNKDEIKQFDITSQLPDNDIGYILETDLEYPQYLHDSHNDYPFCGETKTPPGGKIKKLLLTFDKKSNYVIHYLNLKQCLQKGVVCKKIHRILAFDQSPWLKPYIDLNSLKRAHAQNSFEKDFFKLMNNSIFGKTIENVEKRVDVKLCHKWSSKKTQTKPQYGLERYISKPNFHSIAIFSEELAAVQLNKSKIVYDKPIYVGFAVLELSKYSMYGFHYDYMLPKYGTKLSLLYTDTDSFVYHIITNNFYEDIKSDLEQRFDTSTFPKDNIHGDKPKRRYWENGLIKGIR